MGNWSDYILKLFQSTLPRRERQLLPKFLTNFQYFNPHSHEGSDTTPGVKDSKLAKFQSTLPRRERQQMERYTRQKHKISIHTPTKGATAILTNNFLIFCSISLINFILYLQIIQILFIFRYKFIFYFIF